MIVYADRVREVSSRAAYRELAPLLSQLSEQCEDERRTEALLACAGFVQGLLDRAFAQSGQDVADACATICGEFVRAAALLFLENDRRALAAYCAAACTRV